VVSRVPGGDEIVISDRSCLVLDGDITLHSLSLDGALEIRAVPGASVAVRSCAITNRGYAYEPCEPGSEPKGVSIRGYVVGDRSAGCVISVEAPGAYELTGDGQLTKLG
jgi:hypothetical protein